MILLPDIRYESSIDGSQPEMVNLISRQIVFGYKSYLYLDATIFTLHLEIFLITIHKSTQFNYHLSDNSATRFINTYLSAIHWHRFFRNFLKQAQLFTLLELFSKFCFSLRLYPDQSFDVGYDCSQQIYKVVRCFI